MPDAMAVAVAGARLANAVRAAARVHGPAGRSGSQQPLLGTGDTWRGLAHLAQNPHMLWVQFENAMSNPDTAELVGQIQGEMMFQVALQGAGPAAEAAGLTRALSASNP